MLVILGLLSLPYVSADMTTGKRPSLLGLKYLNIEFHVFHDNFYIFSIIIS